MTKNIIIGKNMNFVLKMLYRYKKININFNLINKRYLHIVKGNCQVFFHFYYNSESIITKVNISSWNRHKKTWNIEKNIQNVF